MYVLPLMVCVDKKITFPKIPESADDLDRILKATGFIEWRLSIMPIILCINFICKYRSANSYFTKICICFKFNIKIWHNINFDVLL